jgi:hypothetical protein
MSDGDPRAHDPRVPLSLTVQGLSHFQSTQPWTHRNPLPFCNIHKSSQIY